MSLAKKNHGVRTFGISRFFRWLKIPRISLFKVNIFHAQLYTFPREFQQFLASKNRSWKMETPHLQIFEVKTGIVWLSAFQFCSSHDYLFISLQSNFPPVSIKSCWFSDNSRLVFRQGGSEWYVKNDDSGFLKTFFLKSQGEWNFARMTFKTVKCLFLKRVVCIFSLHFNAPNCLSV